MARHIMIIERSEMMRRILKSRILANIDDAVIHEQQEFGEAAKLISNNTYHLILYSWDVTDNKDLSLYERLVDECTPHKLPVLLLVSDQEKYIREVERHGIMQYLKMPCSSEELGALINKLCNPVSLRRSERFSLPGTVAELHQRSLMLHADVLNISLGGMLCEFKYDPQYDIGLPLMATLSFPLKNKKIEKLEGVFNIVANMKVASRNPDFTPKVVRAGYIFANIAEETKQRLQQIISAIESEQQQVVNN